MNIGDTFTIGGVTVADKRPHWLRLWHWIIRKPVILPLQTYIVTAVTAGYTHYEQHKDKYL